MSLPVAILAGGLATRLRPLTERVPKALIEVAGRPFIDHQLELLQRQGCSRVVLCLGYLGEMVERHLGSGAQFGVKLEYAFDGEELRGTGGAVRHALPQLGDSFFVLYGDSYLLCDFRQVEDAFLSSTYPALMTISHNDNRWDRSNVVYGEGRVIRYDKRRPLPQMRHIDYGLSALHATALKRYDAGAKFDLGDLYSDLANEGRLAGFEVKERFYEIGSPEGLGETESFLSALSFPEPKP